MQTFLNQLERVLGGSGLLTGEQVRGRASSWLDSSPNQALAIMRPESTEELSAALKVCNQHKVSVVAMGGLTGLVNGAIASTSEVGLSLERMNKIVELDPIQKTAVVEAGVALQVLHEAASVHDCHFAVDLGARGSATIGGMISTNAGGTEVLRFGMMREQVLGLEVVLADGRVMSSMRPLLKNNTGYDLKQLFIGAEGTLGIVTKAMVRLRPRPLTHCCALLAVESFEEVLQLLAFLQQRAGLSLGTFEVMWQSFYDHVLANNKAHKAPFAQSPAFTVIVECTGTNIEADQDSFEAMLGEAFEQGLCIDAVLASTLDQQGAIWAIRDDIETLMSALPNGIMFDVSLPIKHIDSYVEQLKQTLVGRWDEAQVITFGHVGDGNIHLAIALGKHLPAARDALEQYVYTPLEGLSGSISAEHGIGLDKKRYLPLNRSSEEIALMKQIKAVLDPNNILNPGKIF
ncbi:FAD-binding oxidoreductase [Alteromonas sp. ASW11-36]|uniref:FAD-binding oxidoreductase n=1 Tax=Alteromonas arenosi TaxID=3055817 RepID=A0ABT7ST81_9ALTE|nr:FAD-binding oxidoreductase [Alteromonas sp. ASW11-36]MDM7859402.1 FAD-binding oxidoreductase [Alteromonas sp. ASW11-36]